MPWIGVSPVFFIFLGDARRLQRIGELRGKPVKNGTLEGFFNASVDAALAMQTMILCAEAAGLGVCPISVIRNEVDRVAAILELPDLYFPSWVCASDIRRLGHISLRLPRSVTTHRDVMTTARSRKPSMTTIAGGTRGMRFPKTSTGQPEFGEAAFYGWSEDKARQAADAEGAAFPPHLRSHGFTLD